MRAIRRAHTSEGRELRASHGTERLAQHLGENWGLLVGMARSLAGLAIDPDDLLSEALFTTFRKWRTNPGEIEHINAYIISAMRNRVKDELKSPRSKTTYLSGVEELVADTHPTLPRIDLHAEIVLLREAMTLLPEDQRRVLQALYFEDEKVGRLTEPLRRSRPAVSQLIRRAKSNLKRTMLKILLERDAPTPACRRAASRLPEKVDDVPPTSGNVGRHVRQCARCRRTWGQFTTYSAFAFIGALTICSSVFGGFVQPAAAAALATSTSGASEPGTTERSRRRWRLLTTATLVATGIAAGTYLVWAIPQQLALDASHFHVATAPGPAQSVTYDVSFDSDAQNWTIESLEIEAHAPAESVAAPDGWECQTVGGDVQCSTSLNTPVDASFLVTYAERMPPYELRLIAQTPAGAMIEGIATDEQPRGDGS